MLSLGPKGLFASIWREDLMFFDLLGFVGLGLMIYF